ncbi:YbeD family protein [Candidatus Thalassolituus haligoni]|uniref:YbeD family protein n=1 Tax=Candidatus Thalassolituus haligoni TaxID=3100113 RepID=UPI003517A0DA
MALIKADGQPATTQEAPKIEFPCPDYPIKVVGKGKDNYRQVVLDIFQIHAPGFDIEKILVRDSSKGNFQSLTIYITATGIEQLEALHKELSAHELVHMVI